MMDLSIIIPIYNGEKTISDCLNSILENNDNNFEIILINDGSTDNTEKICKQYQNKDKRIKYFEKKNSGVSDTRNFGISISTGKWIMFVDCDDLLVNNWYKIVSQHYSDKFDMVVFSSRIKKELSKDLLLDCIFNIVPNTYLSSPTSEIINRKFLLDNNIDFKKGIINGEDMLFNASIITKCSNYKIVNKGIYRYRLVTGSATQSFKKDIFNSDKLFQKELLKLSKNSKSTMEKYINYSKMNALYTFAYRLSFIKMKEAKEYYSIFKDEFYNYKNEKSFKIGVTKRIVIQLIKYKLISLAILFIKLKRKLIEIKNKRRQREVYIEI